MSMAPAVVKERPKPVEQRSDAVVQILREQVIVKEPAASPKGWRFVPHRDENNLIVEIIATPIE